MISLQGIRAAIGSLESLKRAQLSAGTPPAIYVAGPIGSDPAKWPERRAAAVALGELVWALGAVPFVPHVLGAWHEIAPHSYEGWLDYDAAWLRRCDALVRLEGESPSSDREVTMMRALGRPVLMSVGALFAFVAEWPR